MLFSCVKMFITVNYASVAFHRHPTRQEHSIHVHTACTGTASEYINYSGSTMIIKPFKSYYFWSSIHRHCNYGIYSQLSHLHDH